MELGTRLELRMRVTADFEGGNVGDWEVPAPHRVRVRRGQGCRYGESVTESVASTTMSAGFTVPSASDPGTASARKTV